MSENKDYLVQFSGITVSLGEGAFKTIQTKIAGKLAEKGVTLHVASQYDPDVKRTKFQPYKFLIRNIWTLEKLQMLFAEENPVAPKGFGPVKGYPLGFFKKLKQESNEGYAKIIPHVEVSGKSQAIKIFIGLKNKSASTGPIENTIETNLIGVIEDLKKELGEDFQGYFLFKKHLLKKDDAVVEGDTFMDYVCELFATKCSQKCATGIEKLLDNFSKKEERLTVIFGAFRDFATSQS